MLLKNFELIKHRDIMVEALCYNPEGHGFKTDEVSVCFQFTQSFQPP
jgi:hypothetical protein